MGAGFDLLDVPDKPTINPSYLMQAGNWDILSASMQREDPESPQGTEHDLPFGYPSLPAPAPLGGTGSAPGERAAVCTDSSTVDCECLGDDKISQSVPTPSS